MKILKNITVRKMLLIILTIFTLIWGIATGLTLKNFSETRILLENSEQQKAAYALLVKGNDQYFRSVTRMLRAMDYQQDNKADEAAKTFANAEKALKISQDMLSQFRKAQHVDVPPELSDAMINDWETLLSTITPMLSAARNNQVEQFRQLFRHTYPPLSVKFGETAEKYTRAIQSNVMLDRANDSIAENRVILLSALLAGILTLILTDRYLVKYLTSPLNNIKNHLEKLTAGKLHVEIDDFGRNCAGQLIPYIRSMQNSLRETVSAIQETSSSLYVSTGRIREGNEKLSARTDQQAAAIQETSASMEELTSTVKNNAENVQQARVLSEETQEMAKKGGELTGDVVETMENISESSRKIADITGVINSISFQTNILALNAAVEAARAGEQGRGFAVVASEVRSLAQRSAQAAKEIEALINESVSRVQTGSELVTAAGKAMDTIISSVTHVNALMGEISIASDEQSKGIAQIGLAMNEMDGVTQQNAVLVQEASSSAEELEKEAQHLAKIIAVFDLEGEGHKSVKHEARPLLNKSPGLALAQPASGRNNNWETF
ncbi:methyl-accepting chemotaxis sensory transducer with TarH sensor [Enterobacter sp. kpr-6]|uniref:methyl-accepting chemotaxis protein n=1 Tax=Enterobacter sp. kpr-6 TaxID=1761782 RepID=UPI0008F14D53|nr:methyl-accepting chemotaxis protein [Enterobacter sp. kpr-6]SFQ98503.1 methyl-accepting chemotaxis sensory transducer with TarH sensor [Enterobacter sp. kpr-6]